MKVKKGVEPTFFNPGYFSFQFEPAPNPNSLNESFEQLANGKHAFIPRSLLEKLKATYHDKPLEEKLSLILTAADVANLVITEEVDPSIWDSENPMVFITALRTKVLEKWHITLADDYLVESITCLLNVKAEPNSKIEALITAIKKYAIDVFSQNQKPYPTIDLEHVKRNIIPFLEKYGIELSAEELASMIHTESSNKGTGNNAFYDGHTRHIILENWSNFWSTIVHEAAHARNASKKKDQARFSLQPSHDENIMMIHRVEDEIGYMGQPDEKNTKRYGNLLDEAIASYLAASYSLQLQKHQILKRQHQVTKFFTPLFVAINGLFFQEDFDLSNYYQEYFLDFAFAFTSFLERNKAALHDAIQNCVVNAEKFPSRLPLKAALIQDINSGNFIKFLIDCNKDPLFEIALRDCLNTLIPTNELEEPFFDRVMTAGNLYGLKPKDTSNAAIQKDLNKIKQIIELLK